MEKLVYEFKDHFEVSSSGEKEKAEKITLPSPNNIILKHVTILDQEFNKAMLKISEKSIDDKSESDKDKDKDKISGKEVFLMLSGGGANLPGCFDAMKQICFKQGKINESSQMTDHIWGKMSFQDTKELLGGYINHFLFSSLVD